jgi:hypothetical protein
LRGAFAATRSGDPYGSRDMLRVVGSTYLISELGSALAWQLFVRRISILRRRRHRRIFNARSAVPHADRTGASTRCVRRIVPTLNFVTGILLADGSNFFRRASESAVIWCILAGFSSAACVRGHAAGGAAHRISKAPIAGAFPMIGAHSKAAAFAFSQDDAAAIHRRIFLCVGDARRCA